MKRTLLTTVDLAYEGRFNGALLAPHGRTVVFEAYRPPPPNCQGTLCDVFALYRRPLARNISSTRVVCNDCSASAWSADGQVLLITRLRGQLELRVVRDGRTKVDRSPWQHTRWGANAAAALNHDAVAASLEG